MSYILLPTYTKSKSKSISFINSPKLWFSNFMNWLKQNHFKLYIFVVNIFYFIKYFLTFLFFNLLSFQVGYFIICTIKNSDNIKEIKNNGGIQLCIMSLSFGFTLLLLLFMVYIIMRFLIFELLKNAYLNILDFITVLQLYNSYKNKLDISNPDCNV